MKSPQSPYTRAPVNATSTSPCIKGGIRAHNARWMGQQMEEAVDVPTKVNLTQLGVKAVGDLAGLGIWVDEIRRKSWLSGSGMRSWFCNSEMNVAYADPETIPDDVAK